MRYDIYDEDRALNAFGNTFQLTNIDKYNSQYLYLMHKICINSYNFQDCDFMHENSILGKKKVQSWIMLYMTENTLIIY